MPFGSFTGPVIARPEYLSVVGGYQATTISLYSSTAGASPHLPVSLRVPGHTAAKPSCRVTIQTTQPCRLLQGSCRTGLSRFEARAAAQAMCSRRRRSGRSGPPSGCTLASNPATREAQPTRSQKCVRVGLIRRQQQGDGLDGKQGRLISRRIAVPEAFARSSRRSGQGIRCGIYPCARLDIHLKATSADGRRGGQLMQRIVAVSANAGDYAAAEHPKEWSLNQ